MRAARVLSCLLLCFMLSCGLNMVNTEKIRAQLIQDAITNVPSVREFHALYPNAKIEVYSRQFQKGTTVIQMDDLIYDRYLLTLTAHIEVDAKTRHITSWMEPLITLVEILSASGSSNGPVKSDYGANFKITPAQWQQVVGSRGQFPAAGIAIKTNEPAAGISIMKAYRTGKTF